MIMVYWYGTTTLAGASVSERLTHASATTDSTPNSTSSTKSRSEGAVQPNGAAMAPNTSVDTSCPDMSTICAVFRSMRVVTSKTAKNRLPLTAISAGSVKLAGDGRNASTTPAKPTATAAPRRQPVLSLSTTVDNTVT